jgi:hypothetical protein
MFQEFYSGLCLLIREFLYLLRGRRNNLIFILWNRIQFLRHMRDFFGTIFKMETENRNEEDLRVGTEKILMTCVGAGYTNLSKTMT